MPPSDRFLRSREYKLFLQHEKRPLTLYERTARASTKLLRWSPSARKAKELESLIQFTGLRVTPTQVQSLLPFSVLAFILLGVALIITGLSGPLFGAIIAILGFPLGYFLTTYPQSYSKTVRIRASSQVVLAVLYLVVSMRISPNLERALRFAAANISGALAWDLRKLLWDIEMRKYFSAAEAMDAYIAKWKQENEEFAEALRLIRDSETQTPEKGKAILDQALTIILEGTKTRMKHYAQDLRLPVMVIHMMGIMLPVLGSIMAPLVAVFMSNLVSPIHFIIGYDIVLPLMLVAFIHIALQKRPMTFSPVDVSKHPALPKEGRFNLGRFQVPSSVIAILVLAAFLIPSALFFSQNPSFLLQGLVATEGARTFDPSSLLMSLLITVGLAASIATYSLLGNTQRLRVQRSIQKIEGEFELALFQFGNRISGGTPTEVAVEKSIDDMKDLQIANFFRRILRNIRSLGMTFEQAIFHPEWGAIRFYPSKLVRNIMSTIVDTSRRGVSYAADSMLRIATYLKNIRETQEYIRDLLEETTSSMKFQAYFLTPIITGLIVSISDIITQILTRLGEYLSNLGLDSSAGFGDVSKIFGNAESSVSPELFQLIIGVYLIEVIVILGMFLTKINEGDNRYAQAVLTGRMLLIGVAMYFLVALVSSLIFGDFIRSALGSLGAV